MLAYLPDKNHRWQLLIVSLLPETGGLSGITDKRSKIIYIHIYIYIYYLYIINI